MEPVIERVIGDLHQALDRGEFQHGPYRLLRIHEPKRRLIAAARVEDRIVHHAVCRVLSPLFDPSLVDTTYACIQGRGSHRAVLRFIRAARRYGHVLLLDVRRYFPSIDRGILMDLVARRLKDHALLRLLENIAESGQGIYQTSGVADFLGFEPGFPPEGYGLPIGNLTSQWWGNHYLSGVDHFVKRELKIPHYQRYMDDMTLFSNEPAQLEDARAAIGEWLDEKRHLRLKKPNVAVRTTDRDVTYLGYRVGRRGARAGRSMLSRMEQRIGQRVLFGDIDGVEHTVNSYRGVWFFMDVIPTSRRH